jgi:hypothetical protein
VDHNFWAGILRPLFWLGMAFVLALILWLIRRYFPKLERVLFRHLW